MKFLSLIGILFIENCISMPAYYVTGTADEGYLYEEAKLLKKEFRKMIDYGTECFKNGMIGEHFEQAMEKYHIDRSINLKRSEKLYFYGHNCFAAGLLYKYYLDMIKFKDKTYDEWNKAMLLNHEGRQLLEDMIDITINIAKGYCENSNNFQSLSTLYLICGHTSIPKCQNIINESPIGNYRAAEELNNYRREFEGLYQSYAFSKNTLKRREYNLQEPEYYLRKMYKMLYPNQEIPENLYYNSSHSQKCCVIM